MIADALNPGHTLHDPQHLFTLHLVSNLAAQFDRPGFDSDIDVIPAKLPTMSQLSGDAIGKLLVG
jgi:hypothetical protein